MGFYLRYPSASASANPSVGVNGVTAPTSSTEVGGIGVDGNLHGISVDNAGVQNVNVVSSTLPTGGATAANQVTQIGLELSTDTNIASITARTPTLGQKNMAGSSPVVIASDQSAVPISAASLPLPAGASTAANQTTMIAQFPATLGQKVKASSLAVTLASDQGAIATSSPVNTNGSIVNTALTATTASTASAPANAVGFIFEAPSDNTNNIRWCIGGTASTIVGIIAEPGRDSGFVPCDANISVCATVSGTNAYSIQWILSA